MFIVIGIGLAAGIQYGSVAILASVAFNTVALGVWRMNWGAEPAVLSGFILVRSPEGGALTGEGGAQAGKKAKPDKEPKPYNARLRVHTTQVKAALQAAVALLPTYVTRWEQVGIAKHENGVVIEFDVRLKKKTDRGAGPRSRSSPSSGSGSRVHSARGR